MPDRTRKGLRCERPFCKSFKTLETRHVQMCVVLSDPIDACEHARQRRVRYVSSGRRSGHHRERRASQLASASHSRHVAIDAGTGVVDDAWTL